MEWMADYGNWETKKPSEELIWVCGNVSRFANESFR